MTTTSLKLSTELKHSIATAAQHAGVTPHAFMLDALRQVTLAAEKKAQFVAQAHAARQTMLQTGTGYAVDEVHAYLRSRLASGDVAAPKAKPWRS